MQCCILLFSNCFLLSKHMIRIGNFSTLNQIHLIKQSILVYILGNIYLKVKIFVRDKYNFVFVGY